MLLPLLFPIPSSPGKNITRNASGTLNSFISNSQLVYASQAIAISHPGHTDKRSATRGPLIERGLRALLTPIKQVLRVIVALHLVPSLAKLY
ncbi:Glucokinase [Fusarium oxysporum f. sp. albedinis]|nr:Glucokinase [Fusarium oxysporum f. sp. albedinis]